MCRDKMLHDISTVICCKDSSITYHECYENSKIDGGICANYDKCIIEEKSEEQLKYIVSSIEENIYLEACPGSGKTEVVGIKAAYEISKWSSNTSGIAVLSFTNNSADVIKSRVSKFLGCGNTSYPHFIGTIDSWLHSYIAQPFGHLITKYEGKGDDRKISIVDEKSFAPWLNNLCTFPFYFKRNGMNQNCTAQVLPNQISYEAEKEEWIIKLPFRGTNTYITAEDYYNTEAVQDFVKANTWYEVGHIEGRLRECKCKFLKEGYATYKDVEELCYEIITEYSDIAKRIAKRFPFIIIDEAQDLSWIEIEIFRQLQEYGVIVHTVGDLNQAIYSFKNVNIENFKRYVNKSFSKLKLSTNFRSCEGIIKTCSQMLKINTSGHFHLNSIEKPCLVYSYDESKMKDISIGYMGILVENDISIEKSAILSRGWGLNRKISNTSSQNLESAPFILTTIIRIYNPNDISNLKYALELLGKVLSLHLFNKMNCSRHHFYKPDCIKSNIVWRKFLHQLLLKLIDTNDIADLSQTWSKWCSAANNHFINKVEESATACGLDVAIKKDVDTYSFKYRAPNGYAKKNIHDAKNIPVDDTIKIRKTTIHQVKGETLSSVLLVSTEKNSGRGEGYWRNWIESPQDEIGRFAYVASSRPKDLLVWAVPKKSIKEINLLKNIGFEYKGQIN